GRRNTTKGRKYPPKARVVTSGRTKVGMSPPSTTNENPATSTAKPPLSPVAGRSQHHRPLGWGTLDGPTYLESLKALAGLAPATRFRPAHLRVSGRGLMFVNVLQGTRDGGAFEEPRVHVYEFDDQGRACRQDFYALDQLDEARARFDELTAAIPV